MSLPRVLITTVTNRGFSYISNIAQNFLRQIYPAKKLCIIINDNTEINKFKSYFHNKIKDVLIFSMSDNSLGECLNKSIDIMLQNNLADIWCKMDDDDYYGSSYLIHNVKDMVKQKVSVVGRRDSQVYIPEKKELFYYVNGGHNKLTNWVQGASLTVWKNVFKKHRFPNQNKGEDTTFLKNILKSGHRIYAGGVSDFVIIRHIHNDYHTWKVNINKFMSNCRSLGKLKTEEFEKQGHITDIYQSEKTNINNVLEIVKPYFSGKI